MISPLHASTSNGLKAAFEELTYSLEVEWDQKDEAFKKNQMSKFNARVNELKAQGLTNSELLQESLSQVKDQTLRKQIETAHSLMAIDQISDAEAREMIKTNFEKSMSRGASWNGDAFTTGLAIVLVILVIVSLTIKTPEQDKDLPMGEQPDGSYCGYTQVCRWEEPDCFFYSYSKECDPNSFWYGSDVYTCENEYHCVK